MELLPARNEGGRERDTRAASKIPGQVDESGGVAGFLLGDEIEGHGVDWHEQERQTQALHDASRDCMLEVDIQIEACHLVKTVGGDEQTEDHQPAGLDFG